MPSQQDPVTNRRAYLPLDDFGEFIHGKVAALAHGYINNRSSEVAALAQLRQAFNKPFGTDPNILRWTSSGLPERSRYPDSGPSSEERAAHTAITLFAIHQQSNRDRSAHHRGSGFGYAAAQLVRRDINVTGVQRRFAAIGTAHNWNELVTHARGLITLFKAGDVPLDYVAFAQDLVLLQGEETRAQVRLRWGREFYRAAPADNKAETTASVPTPSGESS